MRRAESPTYPTGNRSGLQPSACLLFPCPGAGAPGWDRCGPLALNCRGMATEMRIRRETNRPEMLAPLRSGGVDTARPNPGRLSRVGVNTGKIEMHPHRILPRDPAVSRHHMRETEYAGSLRTSAPSGVKRHK